MKIVSKSNRGVTITLERVFRYRDDPGAGCAFVCDASGIPLEPMNEAARENYRECLTGFKSGTPVDDLGVRSYEHHWKEAAVGECNHCRTHVILDSFTNTCEKCGADYNSAGQMLSPREQWGEETGEHWIEWI